MKLMFNFLGETEFNPATYVVDITGYLWNGNENKASIHMYDKEAICEKIKQVFPDIGE